MNVLKVLETGKIAVPASNVYAVPADMAWDTAVMVEPFSFGANVCGRTAVGEDDEY